MYVVELMFHNLITEPCPGWEFHGEAWTNELKEKVNSIFEKYLKYEQYSSFNYWTLMTNGKGWIVASRFTWQNGCLSGTLDKLETDLKKYYKEG